MVKDQAKDQVVDAILKELPFDTQKILLEEHQSEYNADERLCIWLNENTMRAVQKRDPNL